MEYEIIRKEDCNTLVFQEAELLESFNEEKYGDLMIRLANEDRDMILDFSRVEVVDSLFIADLIILHKKMSGLNRKLTLKGLNPFLKDLFEKLNLTHML